MWETHSIFYITVIVYPISTMTLWKNDCLTPIQYLLGLWCYRILYFISIGSILLWHESSNKVRTIGYIIYDVIVTPCSVYLAIRQSPGRKVGNVAKRVKTQTFKVHFKNLFLFFLTVLFCCDGGGSGLKFKAGSWATSGLYNKLCFRSENVIIYQIFFFLSMSILKILPP